MKKHNKIVAIQGDAIQTLNSKTDTTLLLALEAQRRGYKIYYYETKNLTFSNNSVHALSKEVKFFEPENEEHVSHSVVNWQKVDNARFIKVKTVTVKKLMEPKPLDPHNENLSPYKGNYWSEFRDRLNSVPFAIVIKAIKG